MWEKRGQLTIFVIIGVVIIFGIIMYFIMSSNSVNDGFEDGRISVIKDNTLNCFNNVYLNSLVVVGFQGGYSNVTDGHYNGFVNVPYYYKQGKLNSQGVEEVERELEEYVSKGVEACVNYDELIAELDRLSLEIEKKDLFEDDYSNFEFSFTNRNAEVKITEDSVEFVSDLDLVVKDVDGKTSIIEFKKDSQVVNSQIYSMIAIANYVSDSLYNENEELCLTCVEEIARESELTVEFLSSNVENDQYVIISNELTSIPFVYQFLNKYNEVFEDEDSLL